MNIENLFYLEKYNPNFIHDFYLHVNEKTSFEIINVHNDRSDYVFQLGCHITDKTAFEIFNSNINELTIDHMNKICINNFTDLISIRKMKQKIINESEYEPLFSSAKVHLQYDIINRAPYLEIHFNLHLIK